jgi:UDP-glucose 4-epimerase
MKILVTGGAGYIARHLLEKINDHEVVSVDIKTDVSQNAVIGDLRDSSLIARLFETHFDTVIHLAGYTRVLDSIKDPKGYFENNVEVTFNLLEAAINVGVKHFIFASTNAVIGDVGFNKINESFPMNPMTPYGATKAACENLINAYGYSYGIKTSILRFSNVYGRNMETKDSFIARLLKAAQTDKRISIYGDGSQMRDYIFIDDVVNIINRLVNTGKGAGTLIAGSGISVKIKDLVELFQEISGVKLDIRYDSAPDGEMPAVILDNAKLMSFVNGNLCDLTTGLSITLDTWGFRLNPY